jgi:hypothetical protein
MKIIKTPTCILLAAYLACCQSAPPAPPPPATAAPKPIVVVSQLPDDLDSLNIPFDFFAERDIVLTANGTKLDTIAALKALFPGFYAQHLPYYENANVVVWQCQACPKSTYVSSSMTEADDLYQSDTFPLSFLNYTTVIGTLDYTEKQQQKTVVFFSTGSESPGSGRFAYGVLGAAVFRYEHPDNWRLETFTPMIVGEGSFNQAHPPERVIQYGDQTFFELVGGYANGGGASALYHGEHLFTVHKGGIRRVLYDVDAHFEVWAGEEERLRLMGWTSEVTFEPRTNAFPDIVLVTKGHFELAPDEELPTWESISWWPGLQKFLGASAPCDFLMKRYFRFNGNEYNEVRCVYERR